MTACQANPQPDKSIAFLGTVAPGDTNDNMPDIAVSTGGADTLECLMLRVGIPASEYVAGAGSSGHIHIFSGGNPGTGTGTGSGTAESPPMTGAPTSWTALWDKQADMMPYDIVLLSCEGGETYNSKPDVLESYLNAGGRAFGSHFHYAWFAGSLSSDPSVPAPPARLGAGLATWGPTLTTQTTGFAVVDQTLTGSTKPFPKGVALDQWLGIVGALGVESAPAGQIPIFDENGDVGATNKAQAWLTDNGYTDYLSFDTPVNAPIPTDGGAPQYCGRAVFSDLHLNSGDPNFTPQDSNPPPTGCASHPLSPRKRRPSSSCSSTSRRASSRTPSPLPWTPDCLLPLLPSRQDRPRRRGRRLPPRGGEPEPWPRPGALCVTPTPRTRRARPRSRQAVWRTSSPRGFVSIASPMIHPRMLAQTAASTSRRRSVQLGARSVIRRLLLDHPVPRVVELRPQRRRLFRDDPGDSDELQDRPPGVCRSRVAVQTPRSVTSA